MKPAFHPFRTSGARRPVPAWRALASLAAAACVACASGQAAAATIRWRTQAVHIKVEGRDVKDVLRDFASGQNVPATVASNISGTVSGDFSMSPQRFLDSLASSFGFVWFYDGNVLSITSANDMARQVVKLNVASASELAAKVQAIEPDMHEKTVNIFADPGAAFANAMSRAGENDRIVVFGSFLTVAGVMAAKKSSLH